jgi:hypothetical protein
MADARRFGLDEVVAYFQGLEDPRSEINRKHPLVSVVVIAVVAVLAGASGPTMIAEWAAFKEGFLASVLPLPHGAPCKDVFRRVLMALNPEAFHECFAAWCVRCATRRRPRPASSGPPWRSTARRCAAATTGRMAWAPCIR